MKTIIFVLLSVAVPAGACRPECIAYQGLCACDQRPEQGPSVQPSDEKPRHNGNPAWQSGEVKAAEPKSLAEWDEAGDRAKAKANAEGKKAAGIK